MAQWVKVFAPKPEDLNLIPHMYTWWKENADSWKLSSDFHTCAYTQIKINFKSFKIIFIVITFVIGPKSLFTIE